MIRWLARTANRPSFFGAVLLAGLAGSSAVAGNPAKPNKPTEYVLDFTDTDWDLCKVSLQGYLAQTQFEGQEISFFWYDFSPREIEFNRNLFGYKLGTRVSRTGAVDLFYADGRNDFPRVYQRFKSQTAIFMEGANSQMAMYEDIVGHLQLSKKSPGLQKAFAAAESQTLLERSEIGLVELYFGQAKDLGGSIRVYDATRSHYFSAPDSPAELMYQAQGRRAWAVDELRRKIPTVELYEIGNWMLAKKGLRTQISIPSRFRLRTKYKLLHMLREKVVKRSKDAYFLVHIATDVHLRDYIHEYGFHVIQEDPIPGSTDHERLLLATAGELKIALDRTLSRLDAILQSQL